MKENKVISPEVILMKLADRLRDKIDDLEFLIYSNNQFEKWLQCELALSMSGILCPVVFKFNESWEEVKDKDSEEKLFDIALEYPIKDQVESLRSDLIVAESPFISGYVDENWKLTGSNKSQQKEIQNDYEKTRWHYIELKQRNWLSIKRDKLIKDILVGDMAKYSNLIWTKFNQYKPSSIVAIC